MAEAGSTEERAGLSYALVTPVRDDAANLERLAECIVCQSRRPERWVLVNNGSSDETGAVIGALAGRHSWVTAADVAGESTATRGAPIVRAFHHGLLILNGAADIVVKLDADLSMEEDYFERLLDEFRRDPSLGIASGIGVEQRKGVWQPKLMSDGSVWGACRAYRRECLDVVLPLEESMGWDGIDVLKANLAGWRTATITDVPFRHHRAEGHRDGSRFRAYARQGKAAHYMGYRFWYLALRAAHRMRYERAAAGLVWGYLECAARREPRCPDMAVRSHLRKLQRIRNVPQRRREVLGKGRA